MKRARRSKLSSSSVWRRQRRRTRISRRWFASIRLKNLGGGYEFDVPLLAGDHVTDDAGTGFVHTAPEPWRARISSVWMDNKAAARGASGIHTNDPLYRSTMRRLLYTIRMRPVSMSNAEGGAARVIDRKGQKGQRQQARSWMRWSPPERTWSRSGSVWTINIRIRGVRKSRSFFATRRNGSSHMDQDLGGVTFDAAGVMKTEAKDGEDTLRTRALKRDRPRRDWFPAAGRERGIIRHDSRTGPTG